ncbi:MAG TPA: hypothetical protein VF974_00220 [Patescibacteria group bacterium]
MVFNHSRFAAGYPEEPGWSVTRLTQDGGMCEPLHDGTLTLGDAIKFAARLEIEGSAAGVVFFSPENDPIPIQPGLAGSGCLDFPDQNTTLP